MMIMLSSRYAPTRLHHPESTTASAAPVAFAPQFAQNWAPGARPAPQAEQ